MRLKDMFEDLAVPIYHENEIPDFSDRLTSSIVGTSDQLYIWGSRFYGPSVDAYAILLDDKTDLQPKAMLTVRTEEQTVEDLKFQDIIKIWVDPKFRGKALSMVLLNFVIKKMKTNLGSGDLLTKDGEKLFKTLVVKKPFTVTIINKKTKVKLKDIPDDLFNYKNDYNIVLSTHICESTGSSLSKLFGRGEGILTEMCQYHIIESGESFGDWD